MLSPSRRESPHGSLTSSWQVSQALGNCGVPFSPGAASPSQFQGLPSRSAIFQQQPENCSPPPTMALTCLGMQQPTQSQQVTIQVQEPVDMLSTMPGAAAGSTGRGISISPSASQIQMQHRANLMATFSYGHPPLSKQLSADSAEAHR
jgi:serine/threonine-protein kinase SIK3